MNRITTEHPYYQDFVRIYNASVIHDNKLGKLDTEHAHELAEAYAELHIPEHHQRLFLNDWEEFYYHMFD